MNSIEITATVGEIVGHHPALARVFEHAGIDYCCGGKKTLDEVCRKKGLDPQSFIAVLEEAASTEAGKAVVEVGAMSLTALVDHIEQTHHGYLKAELPRLEAMTRKVAAVHGAEDSRLLQVMETLLGLAGEMSSHMMKEEQILFPLIRQLEASRTAPAFHCGSLGNPIGQMELEHDQAGSALQSLRALTDGYVPPEWACNTYRAMLDSLAHLENDMHQHVHKENNVLFPRALEMERERSA